MNQEIRLQKENQIPLINNLMKLENQSSSLKIMSLKLHDRKIRLLKLGKNNMRKNMQKLIKHLNN